MKKVICSFVLLAMGLLLACGASRPPTTLLLSSNTIQTMYIEPFKSNDPMISAAVRNAMTGTIYQHMRYLKIVDQAPADLIVTGTITISSGSASAGSLGGAVNPFGGSFLGFNQSVTAQYISGITAQVSYQNALVVHAMHAQTLGKGEIRPAEVMATIVGKLLVKSLRREGMPRERNDDFIPK